MLLTGEPAGFDYVSGGAGILLIQQGGETKLTVTVNPNGTYTVRPTPFLDLAPLNLNLGLEYGVLCMAFHPNYQSNGFVYVVYSPSGASAPDWVLARGRR